MKALMYVLLMAMTSLVIPQPVQWRVDVPDTGSNNVVKTASAIYAIANETTIDSARLVVRVYTLTGIVQNQFTLVSVPSARSIGVEDAVIVGNKLCVAATVVDSVFYEDGNVYACNLDGSGITPLPLPDSKIPRQLALSGQRLYAVCDARSSQPELDRAEAWVYDFSNAFTTTTDVAPPHSMASSITVGPDGYVYALAFSDDPAAPVTLSRFDQLLVPSYQKVFFANQGFQGGYARLSSAPNGQRLYIGGFLSLSEWADRVYVLAVTPSTGQALAPWVLDAGGGGVVGGLVADNTAVYIRSEGWQNEGLRRLSTSLSVVWHKFESGNELQFGIGGDLLMAYTDFYPGGTTTIKRVALSDGALLWTVPSNPGQTSQSQHLLVDAAGNCYVGGTAGDNDGRTTFVAKYRPAAAALSSSSVTGGTGASGSITLYAQKQGSTTFTLSSSSTKVTMPASVTIPNGGTVASFAITTVPVDSNTAAIISVRSSGIVLQLSFTVLAPVIQSLAVTPNSVLGGVNMAGTATLAGPAGPAGRVIALASDKAAAAVPNSVTVPAGSSSAGFTVTTLPVLANTGAVLTATTAGVSKTAFVAVNAPILQSCAITPSSVKGGLSTNLGLTLNGKAPSGYVVQLLSGAPGLVIVPSSTAMTPGSESKSMSISTRAVTTSITITVVAYRGPYVRTATITLTP